MATKDKEEWSMHKILIDHNNLMERIKSVFKLFKWIRTREHNIFIVINIFKILHYYIHENI